MPKSGCCSNLRCPCAFAQNLHKSQPSHVCAACTRTSQTRGNSELSFLRWSQGSAPGSRRHRSVPAEAVESLKSPTWQISSAGSQLIDHKCMPRRRLADSPLVRCDTASFSQCGGQVKHVHACKQRRRNGEALSCGQLPAPPRKDVSMAESTPTALHALYGPASQHLPGSSRRRSGSTCWSYSGYCEIANCGAGPALTGKACLRGPSR